MQQSNNKRVLLGMSGGADSTAAAVLLQQAGYTVVGCTFLHLPGEEAEYLVPAKTMAQKLGIEHVAADLKADFARDVLGYFTNGYLNGITPFPCAWCNIHFKWPKLFEIAGQNNCPLVATGHYAEIVETEYGKTIARGADADKDQSFFLWGLKSEWLNQVVWPLAGLTRAEVMDIARNAGYTPKIALSNSTGLCFSGHSDYRQTLRDLAPDALSAVQPGKFVTTDGEILGQHAGLPNYTIGQRHGLGIWTNQRWYVIGFNQNKNEVILGQYAQLSQSEFWVKDGNALLPQLLFEATVEIRIRYRGQKATGSVENHGARWRVVLDEPEYAITPGQTAVFYRDNMLVGGGFIAV